MLRKFTLDGKEFKPRQDLGNIQQWECEGSWFMVRSPFTRKNVVEEYNDFLECQWLKNEEKDRYGDLA